MGNIREVKYLHLEGIIWADLNGVSMSMCHLRVYILSSQE